ncbi:MAG: creatininase family protein [Candidatus Latescibacteria bacterium]|jgi:creatinine amidohydrolase|nr:creatininase family protein [Candidatus Latescibacterota bacterium]
MKKYYEPEKVTEMIPRESIPDEVRALYLRPGEILSIQDTCPIAFQPLGTLEWHGRHNPIGCDSIKAEELCIEAAKRVGGIVMPAMHFSNDAYRDVGKGQGMGMDATAGFQLPGSFYMIDVALLRSYLINACQNYLDRGFKLVIIVSGHNPGLQQNMLDEVCYIMKEDDGREPVVFTMEYQVMPEGDPRRHSDHAGGYETSMMLHLAPDRVNMNANDNLPEPNLGVGSRTPVSEATGEEGQIRFDMQVEGMVRFAQEKLEALG